MHRGTEIPHQGFDHLEETDEVVQNVAQQEKDWFKPAAASMARLNQVKTNVYNLGLLNAGSLKPPRSVRKTNRSNGVESTGQGKPKSAILAEGTSFQDLLASPPISTVSYKKSAWGSNSSIPELITKQAKSINTIRSQRPSSAKLQQRTRPQSAGKGRPQSAKEPLCEGKEGGVELDVQGHRKDMTSKSSPRGGVSSCPGYVHALPHEQAVSQREGKAWAGPPAGYKLDPSLNYVDTRSASSQIMEECQTPQAPCSSPMCSDGEDEQLMLKTPPLLRRPISQPIHLSLPTVDDGPEENKDDLNTERLLEQANKFVSKAKVEGNKMQLKNVKATLPVSASHDTQSDLNTKASPSEKFVMETIVKKSQRQKKAKICPQKDGNSSQRSSQFTESSDITESDESESDDSSINDSSADDKEGGLSVKIMNEQKCNGMEIKHGSQMMHISDQQAYGLKSSPSTKSQKKFLHPDENYNSYKLLEFPTTKFEVGRSPENEYALRSKLRMGHTGVQIREDMNITVDITPRNVGRKVVSSNPKSDPKKLLSESQCSEAVSSDHSDCYCSSGLDLLGLTPEEIASFKETIEKPPMLATGEERIKSSSVTDFNHQTVPSNSKSLVSMVSVQYEGEEEKVPVKLEQTKKKKSMNEVETLVSQLSVSETGISFSHCDDPAGSVSQLLHRSKPEQNYYEMARSSSPYHPKPDTDLAQPISEKDSILLSNNKLYKTTKTIEFSPGTPEEVVSRSIISSQRPDKSPSVPLWPSDIKKQQENHKLSQSQFRMKAMTTPNKDAESKMDVLVESQDPNMNELEKLVLEAKTMAKSSLSDAAKHRPSSGKKSSAGLKSQGKGAERLKVRPASAVVRTDRATDISRSKEAIQALCKDQDTKRYSMYSSKPTQLSRRGRIKSAGSVRQPVILSTLLPENEDIDSHELQECYEMQSKMAALGVDVDPRVLERALYAPSGKSLYYDVPGQLPKNPSNGLLSHYKYWMSEDYHRLQLMNRRLARDDHVKYLQKVALEKKAKRIAKKGNKGGKQCKLKLVRSNSLA